MSPLRAIREPPQFENTEEGWRRILDYLLRAGAQAPSWYNCQPWKLRVSGFSIEVFLDEGADRSLYNWKQFHSLLACGAVIENIVIAARGRGLDADVRYTSESLAPGKTEPLAKVEFRARAKPGEVECDEDLEKAIWPRHTNPLLFENSPLTDSQRRAIVGSIKEEIGVSLHLLETDEGKHKAFQAVSLAERIRFSRRDLHEYLHRMIRWDEAETRSNPSGYTLPSMGLCGFASIFFRFTRSWSVVRLVNLFGARRHLADRANLGLKHCAAVGLLVTREKDRVGLLNAGRSIQRLWLTASRLGLSLQPHSAITAFHWAWLEGGATRFSPAEHELLESAFAIYSETFSDTRLGKGEMGVFLFRLGKGPPPLGYTWRREP